MSRSNEYIFSRSNGSRFYIDSFIVPLQKAAKEVGIKKGVDIPTLIHSYGPIKIRLGWGIRKVSQILGHSNIQITASSYSHLLDEDLKVRDECLSLQEISKVFEAATLLI